MMLILVAVIIGVPMSLLLGSFFLETFAYRIEISPLLVVGGILVIAGLGLLIICSQTINAARSNPVKSLRYE